MRKAIAVLAAVYLLCLAGCSGQENIDTMNLQLVSGLVSEKGYDGDNFLEKLAGQSREDMISLWGEPDGQLSGFWGDTWNLEDNNSHYIVLYYDSEGYVEDVVVGTNAHYHIENIVDRTKTEGLPYDTAEEKFFEDSDNEYYFSGIYSHYVIVHYEDGSQEDIVTALNAGRATIADLDKFEIEYIVKALGDGDNADGTETTSSEQQTIPNLGPAEQSYSVGEPRCEDEDSAVEGCYDDPNNPLAEQTYRVGEPRYE